MTKLIFEFRVSSERLHFLSCWRISFDAEIAVADGSIIDDFLDHSTAEELVMSDDFVDGQDGSGVDSRDVIFGLFQMKLEEPGYSEDNALL